MRNHFVCQTKKVLNSSVSLLNTSVSMQSVSPISSTSLVGLSSCAKAGIVIGVLIGVTIIVGVGIFVAKRFNLSVATLHSVDNSLHSTLRGQSLGPKG